MLALTIVSQSKVRQSPYCKCIAWFNYRSSHRVIGCSIEYEFNRLIVSLQLRICCRSVRLSLYRKVGWLIHRCVAYAFTRKVVLHSGVSIVQSCKSLDNSNKAITFERTLVKHFQCPCIRINKIMMKMRKVSCDRDKRHFPSKLYVMKSEAIFEYKLINMTI